MNSEADRLQPGYNAPSQSAPAQSAALLPFLIGSFFCLRFATTLVIVRVFDSGPQIGSGLNLAIEFTLLASVALDLLRPRVPSASTYSNPGINWVLAYLGFAGVSLFWSAAASLPASLAYWSGTAADVTLLLLLFRRGDLTPTISAILRGFLFGACIIAILAWCMPAQEDLRLGDEDYFNANTIANLCAFGFFFAQILRRLGSGRWQFVSFFLCITLLRSLSKATIAAFLVASTFLLLQDRSLSRRTKLALTAAALVVILIFWGLFELYFDIYTSTGNQAQTLTGRTAIWAYVIDSLPEHPWIGHGFDSMWKTVPPFGTFEARHAENEVLQQLYAFGLSGLVLFVGVYASFYRFARRIGTHPVSILLRALLLFVLVRGLAESEPFDLLLPLWTVVLFGAFSGHLLTASPVLSSESPLPYLALSLEHSPDG